MTLLLACAAGASGPALADAIARRRSLPEAALLTLATNPNCPLDIACEIAFGMGQPGWLLDRDDLDDDLVRAIVLCAAQQGDNLMTDKTARAVADADDSWYATLLDSSHVEFFDTYMASGDPSTTAWTHRPHPADRVEAFIRRLCDQPANPHIPEWGIVTTRRLFRAYPQVAHAVRNTPTGIAQVDLVATTTQVVTGDNLTAILAELDDADRDIATAVATHTHWTASADAAGLLADRLRDSDLAAYPTVTKLSAGTAAIGHRPAADLTGWVATATDADLAQAIETWRARMIQVGHLDPTTQPIIARHIPTLGAGDLIDAYGPDIVFDMPLLVLMSQGSLSRHIADRLDQLGDGIRAALLRLTRDAKTRTESFNDLVSAVTAAAGT